MAEPAIRPMTVDEFLDWEDGTDTRYELIGGFPLAMAPPREVHGVLTAELARRIGGALVARRPCRVSVEAGIVLTDRADTFYVADLAVTCAPYDARRQYVQDPILIVEILSPSTERHDTRIKLPAYRSIASVQEILLLDSDARFAQLHRRQGEQWITELVHGEAMLPLATVGIEISMAELYDGLVFENEPG